MSALSLHDLDRVSIVPAARPLPLTWARDRVLGPMQLSSVFDHETGDLTVNHDFCVACHRLTRREQLRGSKPLCRTCREVIAATSVDRLLEITAIAIELAEPGYEGDDL